MVVPFDTVIGGINRGECFNTVTHVFTAPKDGLYLLKSHVYIAGPRSSSMVSAFGSHPGGSEYGSTPPIVSTPDWWCDGLGLGCLHKGDPVVLWWTQNCGLLKQHEYSWMKVLYLGDDVSALF